MKHIHINCDLGEGGEYDRELMPLVSACNIACGGHAGTLETMHHTVALAMEHQTEIGAHPSYPDKENFGRNALQLSATDLKRSLVAQILSLKQIAEAEGGRLGHVKPHGALYNEAARDEDVAGVVIEAILEFEDPLPLYVPPGSVIESLAQGNIRTIREAFADRNYREDLRLVSRGEPHALITEKEEVYRHLYGMYFDQEIRSETGKIISCEASTFCLHSDTPDAVSILEFLHRKFREENVVILKYDS